MNNRLGGERENGELDMKRILMLSIATTFLLCACSAPENNPASLPENPTTSVTNTLTPKADSSTPSTIQSIKEYLTEKGYTVVSSKNASSRLEFYTTLPGLEGTVSVAPDNWEDTKNTLLETAVSSAEFIPEEESAIITLYLQDGEGNILASILGDKLSDSFNSSSLGNSTDNPNTITLEEFNAIKTGMEYQEVFDIVGGRGEILSEVDLGLGDEYVTIMFTWKGEGSLGANANVTFQGGKVTTKAQFGLE